MLFTFSLRNSFDKSIKSILLTYFLSKSLKQNLVDAESEHLSKLDIIIQI